MSEAIVVALITGGLSLLGVVTTCLVTARKSEKNQAVAQAVTDTKIVELTREVRELGGVSRRLPALEQALRDLERRLTRLEQQ